MINENATSKQLENYRVWLLDSLQAFKENDLSNGMAEMKEIQLHNNDTGVKEFASGEPDLPFISKNFLDCLLKW